MEAGHLLRSCWVYRPHLWHAGGSHVFSGDPGVSEHREVRGQFQLSSPILEAGPLLRSCWVYRPHLWRAGGSHVFSGDPGVSEHTEVRGQFQLSSPNKTRKSMSSNPIYMANCYSLSLQHSATNSYIFAICILLVEWIFIDL